MVKAYKPENLFEALEIIASDRCTIFAGGTDLMVKRRQWAGLEPEFKLPVLFIGHLKELKSIDSMNGYLTIGAACTLTSMLENKIMPDILKKAVSEMASPSIRNAATIGGNICNSSPAGDILPVLYALNAILIVESKNGKREVPIDQFITGPGKNDIKSEEILTGIKVKLEEFNISTYVKVGTRRALAISKLSFTGLCRKKEGVVEDIRIAFGSVGPTVIRNKGLEREMIESGQKSDIEKITRKYREIIKPIDDQRSTSLYRMETSIMLLRDFLMKKAGYQILSR